MIALIIQHKRLGFNPLNEECPSRTEKGSRKDPKVVSSFNPLNEECPSRTLWMDWLMKADPTRFNPLNEECPSRTVIVTQYGSAEKLCFNPLNEECPSRTPAPRSCVVSGGWTPKIADLHGWGVGEFSDWSD